MFAVAGGLMALFMPDPVMEKLNDIERKLDSLSSEMNAQFERMGQKVDMSNCRSVLSSHSTEIRTTFRSLMAYSQTKGEF